MKKSVSTAAVLAMAAAPGTAGAAVGGPPLPPGFPVLGAHALTVRCDQELERRREMLAAMERRSGPGQVLQEFNALALRTGAFDDPVAVLQAAAPDPETRAAAQSCLEKLMPFGTELLQSARLYARLQAYRPADDQDRSYRQQLMENFEDAGVALAPDKRVRVKELQDELNSLALRFQANLNAITTTVPLAPDQVEGTSADWRAARARDEQGNYLVSLDYPSYGPFMESAIDAEARRAVWTAFQNRGGQVNLDLMDRAVALRSEMAQIYGFPDYATYVLRRRMAGSPQAVSEFLLSVHSAVTEVEERELEDLRAEKALLSGGGADGVRVERWDVAFLQQQVKRRRYDIDPEALRAYFPTDAAVRFAMYLAETLYGIRFVRQDAPVWSPEVQYYEVFEQPAGGSGHGALIGGVYLDLFPRPGKYSHAAAFGVRSGSALTGQHPIKALICNLDAKGLSPAELETLLHEFGHVLHGLLSRARYAEQSGTAVRRDFVEVPSMMFEEWARRPESLQAFAQFCPQCPALDAQLIAQLQAARNFGAGMRYARQWLYASYDLALHTGSPKDALDTWVQLEGASRLGHVEGTLMPASFGHLMSGYEAGYYGYMWSEVLALDMLSVFHGRLLDPAVGRRYRHIVLEPGGSRPPEQIVEEFLGRKPGPEAFYEEITGKR